MDFDSQLGSWHKQRVQKLELKASDRFVCFLAHRAVGDCHITPGRGTKMLLHATNSPAPGDFLTYQSSSRSFNLAGSCLHQVREASIHCRNALGLIGFIHWAVSNLRHGANLDRLAIHADYGYVAAFVHRSIEYQLDDTEAMWYRHNVKETGWTDPHTFSLAIRTESATKDLTVQLASKLGGTLPHVRRQLDQKYGENFLSTFQCPFPGCECTLTYDNY